MKKIFISLLLFSIALIVGCTSSLAPMRPEPASLAAKTNVYNKLQSLVLPKEKIVVAVYKFRDQTGQYKQSSTGTSWSTAVTQGATSILIRALEESGWFLPIEREGLGNLLNERKIIRSSRANYKGANGEDLPPLPPLLYAGIILDGGIISYETNIVTGGVGLKYFGTGGSNQYREDKVTIYLRATSTQNGRVLKTITTSKTILSQMVDVGLFKFVDYQRLLEVETGYSYNEPVDMCVTEAIEKAVYSMVVEGVIDHLWEPSAVNNDTQNMIDAYKEELAASRGTDFNDQAINANSSIGIELSGGLQVITSDYPNAVGSGITAAGIKFPLDQQFELKLDVGFGNLISKSFFDTKVIPARASVIFNFAPRNNFNPYIFGGVGLLHFSHSPSFGNELKSNKITGLTSLGIGFEYFIMKKISAGLKFENNISLSDELDGLNRGKQFDSFNSVKFNLCIYPNR